MTKDIIAWLHKHLTCGMQIITRYKQNTQKDL